MNFKMFMYYCALCGGWAALITWALQQAAGMQSSGMSPVMKTIIIAALLGVLLAGVIGLLDALMNAVGFARVVRIVICLAVGFVGSLAGGGIGELIFQVVGMKFIGWALVGAVIGASIGVFDLLRASSSGKGFKQAVRKIVNGIIGGTIGGAIGGLLNDAFGAIPLGGMVKDAQDVPYETLKQWLPKTSLAVGLVILGMCIGLLIGVAQVVLKEAWVRVEKGFRAGREMILTKPEVIIGRAEGVDIALFGDMQVEKQHARIQLKGDRYILIDLDTPGGTSVNGERISGPTPLSNGDMIGCGNSKVRFQEKAKR
jgi:MFS family permease